MELKKIQYFKAIVENNFNITKTAAKLYISQPALSQIIISMETELGVAIFTRKSTKLTGLTHAGEIFYERAKKIMNEHELMLTLLKNEKSNYIETINIVAPPFLLHLYFAKISTFLDSNFPEVEFKFYEGNHLQIKQGLLNNQYQIGLSTSPTKYDNQNIFECMFDTSLFSAFVDCTHPYANHSFLTWQDLVVYPLSIPGKEFATHDLILEKLTEYSNSIKIKISGSIWEFQIIGIINTNYIAIMPNYVQDFFNNELKDRIIKIPIQDPIKWQAVYLENTSIKKSENFKAVRKYLKNNLLKFISLPNNI